jgi:hypothetical protein
MCNAQMRLGALLHRAGHVDQQQDAALSHAASQSPQLHYVAIVTDCFAQGAPRVEILAAPGAHAPVAGAARQVRRRRAGEAAQHLEIGFGAEVPHRERFHSGRVLPGLVDLVRQQRLGAAGALFLHAHGLVVGLAERLALLQLAQEVRAEQRIEGGAALRRRRERRMGGAADIGDRLRTKQADRREERGGLLRRDREAVRPQQRRERHERPCGTRQDTHAAASARIESSRPDT